MSQTTHDMNVNIESELSISQQINWILDNIYQNYKQGFNTLKEVLILVKNGHNLYDNFQIDHYNNVIDSVEQNIALWENQYEMFDVKNRTVSGALNQKENIQEIDYQKEIIDQNIDVKTYMNIESVDTCQQLQQNFSVNHSQTENFENEWYNSEDIYYMKSMDVLTPTSMDQIINTTIREDIIDSGFEESPLSVQNCDEINSFMLTNLCHDLDSKQDIEDNYITDNSYENIDNTELCPTNNVSIKKRNHNYIRKSRQVDTRIWYKCGWDGCSFGSFYNGVVKRHSYKKHSGKIKIDKSNNSAMHRFKCDWPGCEVSLVAYHKLVEHKRKHTGEKPFKCKYRACNYATARLYSMIIHERTHKLDPNLTLDYSNNK